MRHSRARPPIPPPRPRILATWPERSRYLEYARTIDHTLTSTTFDREAREMRAAVEAGHHVWPPSDARRVDGGQLTPDPAFPAIFDWHHVQCFINLPSVRRWFEGERLKGIVVNAALGATTILEDAERRALHACGLLYMATMWHYGSRRAYYLDRQTAELLASTPLPSLPAIRLNPPFQSFLLVVPDDLWQVQVGAGDPPQPVTGVLAAFSTNAMGSELPRELCLMVTGRSARHPADDNTVGVTLHLRPDDPLTTLRAITATEHTGVATTIVRLVLGFCLYIQSQHARLEPVPAPELSRRQPRNASKQRKLEQRIAAHSQLAFTWVRAAAAADDPERTISDGSRSASQSRHGWRLDHRVPVQAHHKRVRFGPGRSQVKVVRIAEHHRGPDDFADAVHAAAARNSLVHPARRRASET